MKNRTSSERKGLIGCVISAAVLVVFFIYGIMYNYLDLVVLLCVALSVLFSAGYVFTDNRFSNYCNLLAVVAMSYGVGLFFLNSYPVWADRLNHISMYGSRGTLVPVIAIMIMMFAAIVVEIISCFGEKGSKNE